jgi:hypothetical protein
MHASTHFACAHVQITQPTQLKGVANDPISAIEPAAAPIPHTATILDQPSVSQHMVIETSSGFHAGADAEASKSSEAELTLSPRSRQDIGKHAYTINVAVANHAFLHTYMLNISTYDHVIRKHSAQASLLPTASRGVPPTECASHIPAPCMPQQQDIDSTLLTMRAAHI